MGGIVGNPELAVTSVAVGSLGSESVAEGAAGGVQGRSSGHEAMVTWQRMGWFCVVIVLGREATKPSQNNPLASVGGHGCLDPNRGQRKLTPGLPVEV